MKHYYHTYLTALMLSAMVLLCGCASDDDTADKAKEKMGNMLSLRITLASPAGSSRATQNPQGGEIGDGLRVGRYNENSIYNVYLYKYSSADGINGNDDTPVTLLASEDNVNFSAPDAVGDIVKEIKFNVGAYRYEAANHDHFIAAVNTRSLGVNTTLGRLRNELVSHTWESAGSEMKDCDRFTMANANDSHFEGGNGTEDTPYAVSIDVERTAARIDFAYSKAAMTAGKFSIDGDGLYIYKVENTEDEVRLSNVRITNGMQAPPYLIKRLAAAENDTPRYLEVETNPATKYIVEPNTWKKTVLASENGELPFDQWFGDSWYGNAVRNYNSTVTPWFRNEDKVHNGSGDAFTDGTSLDEVDHDWNYYVLGYVNENTMKAEQTLHNYATGLVLKATYVPNTVYKAVDPETSTLIVDGAYTAGTTFWRWHDIDTNADRYFSNQAAAEAYQALFPHSIVFEYTNAECYYNVWLRHENIVDDPTTTMMEFGIVRNNIYRVCVEFTGIGMPDVPDDMVTPENIRMFIYVRKWNLITHPEIEI